MDLLRLDTELVRFRDALAQREFESVEVDEGPARKGKYFKATARRGCSITVEAATWNEVLDALPDWAKEVTELE